MIRIFIQMLLLIRRILWIQYQALVEIYELLQTTFTRHRDQHYLRMETRHLAHMLEKNLQNPENLTRYKKNDASRLQRLESLLLRADKENSANLLDMKWAKRIAKEFTIYQRTGSYCEMLGKVQTELPGLKEIKEANATNSQVAEIDLVEFMKGRRSVRNWTHEDVPDEVVKILVEAGSWAPSSCNRQTCYFIAIKDKKKIAILADTVKGGRTFFRRAPLLLVVVNDVRRYQLPDERHIPYQDAAAAIQNILLMAHRMGLGTCWASFTSGTGIISNERKVRNFLKIPKHCKISGTIAIGKPDIKVCTIPRIELKNIIHSDWIDMSHEKKI